LSEGTRELKDNIDESTNLFKKYDEYAI